MIGGDEDMGIMRRKEGDTVESDVYDEMKENWEEDCFTILKLTDTLLLNRTAHYSSTDRPKKSSTP